MQALMRRSSTTSPSSFKARRPAWQSLRPLHAPYARAIFAVAQDSGTVDAFGQGLALLGAAASAPEVAAMLAAPRPGPAVKAQELAAFLPEGAPEGLRALLTVLAENKRWRFCRKSLRSTPLRAMRWSRA